MIINNINFNKVFSAKSNAQEQEKTQKLKTTDSQMLSAYPSNYYVSFGTRNVGTMYNSFKDTEMPSTVRDYIDDLRLTSRTDEFAILMASPRLYQVQNAAVAKLEDCKTIEDIQQTFPNEEYFKKLKKSTDVNPNGKGIFNLISKKQNEGVHVFDLDEDLTVYLVKKLFLDCSSMTDIQKKMVDITIDDDVKSKIPRPSIWCADTFAPLGIEVPDGIHYGSALLYSEDREYVQILSEAISRSWENLSPEEVTSRIQSLLQSVDRDKYSMMDAWNKCIPVRKKLSEFLFENFDSDKYNQKTTPENYEGNILMNLYKGNYSDKMRKLMNDFWRINPDSKAELSIQVKQSRALYDAKKAEGPEALKKFLDGITDQRNLVRKQLQEEKEKNRSFPNAKNLIQSIASRTNRMYIRTPETDDDFYRLLLDNFKNKELLIYENSIVTNDKGADFNAIFPPARQIAETKNSLEYAGLMNAQVIAILGQDLNEEKIPYTKLVDTFCDADKLDNLVKNSLSKKNNFPEYSVLKQPLTPKERVEIKSTIMEYAPADDLKFAESLNSFIDTQCKYLTLINSSNKSVKTAVALLALQKLDEINGSSCVDNFINMQKREEEHLKKVDFAKNVDWNVLKSSSWDD